MHVARSQGKETDYVIVLETVGMQGPLPNESIYFG